MLEIQLSETDTKVIYHALLESFGGYAGGFLPTFLGVNKEKLEQLFEKVKNVREGNQAKVAFSKEDWRLIYEAINAVVYELGPEELQTITGHEWNEFLNTGRNIYTKVYNRKGTQQW